MSDFLALTKERCSVRSFKPDAIAQDALDYVLEAGRLAPTACNKQGIHIYLLTSDETRAAAASVCKFTFGAPAILCVCKDHDSYWKNPFEDGINSGDIDASIVTTHMMLAAREKGLGSCWVGAFAPSKMAQALALPANHQVVALLPLGYPADDATPSEMHAKRKTKEELVTVM